MSGGFTLAPLRRQDLVRCAELEQELFSGEDPWSVQSFHAELDQGHYYLGAYDGNDGIIGYAGLAIVGATPHFEGEIHTIAVAKEWQGKGIGTALLHALLTKADTYPAAVFLEVRTDNVSAIALYEKHGFRQLGLRRRYYQPSGADAYTMGRPAVATAKQVEDTP